MGNTREKSLYTDRKQGYNGIRKKDKLEFVALARSALGSPSGGAGTAYAGTERVS